MEQTDLELVRGVYTRWAEGDFRSSAGVFHPDILFGRTARDIPLDLVGPFHGIHEMGDATRSFFSAWTRFSIEAEELIDLGDRDEGRAAVGLQG
jgi:ketosteroid isomerase-like protein